MEDCRGINESDYYYSCIYYLTCVYSYIFILNMKRSNCSIYSYFYLDYLPYSWDWVFGSFNVFVLIIDFL